MCGICPFSEHVSLTGQATQIMSADYYKTTQIWASTAAFQTIIRGGFKRESAQEQEKNLASSRAEAQHGCRGVKDVFKLFKEPC